MPVDVERIIQYIKQGDQENVQIHLDDYNTENSQCFFFDVEERERRKQQELDEFRRNKVREFVPDSDSDFDFDENDDADLVLRRRLAAALIWFICMQLQPCVLRECLRTLKIISRDRKALDPLITDSAILTLARLGGISTLPFCSEEEEIGVHSGSSHSEVIVGANPQSETEPGLDINGSNTQYQITYSETDEQAASACVDSLVSERGLQCSRIPDSPNCETIAIETQSKLHEENPKNDVVHGVLTRGKRDARGEQHEEGDDGEVWRKEALKALCNVIYNSPKAQEKASSLRLLQGLSEKLKEGLICPPSRQFYELRLLFLLTALRPELRVQLRQERGVSLLTAALEQCLEVRWGEVYEVLTDVTAPPVTKEVFQRALEVLKTLFNITYTVHRQEVDEEAGALYRHLAAVLRHCLLVPCDGEDRKEELQGHTVNVLSALPLQCLDVVLAVRLSEGSKESGGVNMDCVHTLLLFLEKRLDRVRKREMKREKGHMLKEKLTPVLNLLTESSRAHRETRHYLRHQILPPLREVELRPEQGNTLRSKLVRLMTHVDTEIKHCAAELLFVLCKENVSRFVKYTGYGNAAGLLAARGLLNGRGSSTQPQYSSDSDSDTEEYRQVKDRINPVTGRVEEEQPDPMEGMTEDEKEEEALRLINMFNKLSRDNIIQPMGVTTDGKLAPLCDQMRHGTVEEEVEVEEEEGEDSEADQ